MEISALLTKARADTEIALGRLETGFDTYKTMLKGLPEVAGESLLRLSFLLGYTSPEDDYLSCLEEFRQDFWRAVFEARGGTHRESLEFEAESTSDLAYLGLLYPPSREDEAL